MQYERETVNQLVDKHITLNKQDVLKGSHPRILVPANPANLIGRCCCCDEDAKYRLRAALYNHTMCMCRQCCGAFLIAYRLRTREVYKMMLAWIDYHTTIYLDQIGGLCRWCECGNPYVGTIHLIDCFNRVAQYPMCLACVLMVKIRKYTQHFMLTCEMLLRTTITDLHHHCLIVCASVFIS